MRNDDAGPPSFVSPPCLRATATATATATTSYQPPPSTTHLKTVKHYGVLPNSLITSHQDSFVCVIAVSINYYILPFVPSTSVIAMSKSIYSLPLAPSFCFVQTASKQQQACSSPSYSYQSGITPTYPGYTESGSHRVDSHLHQHQCPGTWAWRIEPPQMRTDFGTGCWPRRC